MSKIFELLLSGLPPSANQMYRTGRNGNRYKRREVSDWQEETAELVRKAWGKPEAYTGEVEVHVVFTVGDKRRWDVDNRLKALLDCLALGGVIEDDRQISGITALRREGALSQTQIEIRETRYGRP